MHAQYDATFYDFIKDRAYTSALEIAPFIHRLIEPTSVVDVGCGSGDWLAVFKNLGVNDILGFDGGAGSEAALRIPREFFRSVVDLHGEEQVAHDREYFSSLFRHCCRDCTVAGRAKLVANDAPLDRPCNSRAAVSDGRRNPADRRGSQSFHG